MKLYRFGHEGAVFQTKARMDDMEGVVRVTETKGHKVSDASRCEEWSYPLWGFGGQFKLPDRRRRKCLLAVIGESYTLAPVNGYQANYRSGLKVDTAGAEMIVAQASSAGAQLASHRRTKRDLWENVLAGGLILLLLVTVINFAIASTRGTF